jgi:hypothetical protein
MPEWAMPDGMTEHEITRLVNRYIGVSGGYLGLPERFTYRTHGDFYSEYCDVDVSFDGQMGTTRETFMSILASLAPRDQAKVLRGVIERFPPDEQGAPTTRAAAHSEVVAIMARLNSGPLVSDVTPQITSDVVLRALGDAENLIRTRGPTSAVDRVHTVLHGYLQAVCADAGVLYRQADSMVAIFRALEAHHPKLTASGPRAQDIKKVLNAFASVLDAMLPVRNQASVAHPNTELLDEPEARLVINASRTILHYLDDKLS